MKGLGWADNPKNVRRMSWREARRVARNIIGVIVVFFIAFVLIPYVLAGCVPHPVLGSTMRPVAFAPAVMNAKAVLSNCTSDHMEAC